MPSHANHPWRLRIAGGLLSGAAAGVAATVATRALGHRRRGATSPELDALARPLDDAQVIHHELRTADGGRLHAAESGRPTGRPVVFMHGVTLQWWVWTAVMRLAGDRFRCVAWDMRGHGRSVPGRDGVTLEAAADDLAILLNDLDLRDALLVGHSMGGMVLGRFLAQYGELAQRRVAGVAFVATSAAPASLGPIRGGLGGAIRVLGPLSDLIERFPALRYDWPDDDVAAALVAMAFGPKASARMIDDVRRMETEMDVDALGEAGRAIAAHDVRVELAGLGLPTTVIVGDHDRLTPPAHARLLAETIPNAELVILHDIGHQVMQEAPDRLVAELRRLDAERAASEVSDQG